MGFRICRVDRGRRRGRGLLRMLTCTRTHTEPTGRLCSVVHGQWGCASGVAYRVMEGSGRAQLPVQLRFEDHAVDRLAVAACLEATMLNGCGPSVLRGRNTLHHSVDLLVSVTTPQSHSAKGEID